MNEENKGLIAFDVDTSRILQIVASEIYDSPKAFLRENVQNAYDAILMRCTAQSLAITDRKIEITVGDRQLSVRDDGIGMTEEVLKNNFWKAGSSGKRSDLAQRSGVIGTFGIGAMANFGVCAALYVESRNIESDETLISSARREDLRIGQECIRFERVIDDREPGTVIFAELDPEFSIDAKAVSEYLGPYVCFLPVPVFVNGTLISQKAFGKAFVESATGYDEKISQREIVNGTFGGTLETRVNNQGRALIRLYNIALNGAPLAGEMILLQSGGQTFGYRSFFGLAPIPINGHYAFGGYVNLATLHPTAGREALSRESIQIVAGFVALIELEVSKDLSETNAADQNQNFQQYILAHGQIALAKRITIPVLPVREDVPLDQINRFELNKPKLFYTGRDPTILQRFGTEQTNLLNVSQANPRRNLQIQYIQNILKIEQVPDKPYVELIPGTQLSFEEAMFLVRLRGVLRDDYLMPEVEVALAKISHGVAFHVARANGGLQISIARDMPALGMVVETYRTARDVFEGFVKDFVREHLYPHIREHVPSSTRQGRDALYRRLKENKELFRYEENEFGEAEALLSKYLAGETDFDEVLRASPGVRLPTQRQEVRREQVGTVEQVIPDIITSPGETPQQNEFEAAPPILRPEMVTDMKVLTVGAPHNKLNKFQMFLALSERAARTEGEFLRWPHTTKIIWGSHRVIYIFADESGELSLYYDIELKEPLAIDATGGAMFPTTTIITKDKIYVPVPKQLEPAFQITAGAKEFYVRFDTLP